MSAKILLASLYTSTFLSHVIVSTHLSPLRCNVSSHQSVQLRYEPASPLVQNCILPLTSVTSITSAFPFELTFTIPSLTGSAFLLKSE